MDHGNSVLRKNCLHSSMATLREVARAFPMVALNERSSRLAVGDAIGDISGATIRVYDIERYEITLYRWYLLISAQKISLDSLISKP